MNKYLRHQMLCGDDSLPSALTYLLNDQFTTNDAAPVTTPRTCEPGPGTLTMVQPGNEVAITSGEMIITAAGAFAGIESVSTYARTGGVGFYIKRTPCPIRDYWSLNSVVSAPRPGAHLKDAGMDRAYGANGEYQPLGISGTSAESASWMINDSAGMTYFVLDGKLFFVSGTSSLGAAKLYYQQRTSGRVNKVSHLAVIDLPASGYTEWSTQRGIATDHVASPATGETITQEADALVDITWTPALGETLDLMVRRTDDSTCWSVVCAEATAASNPDTIKLIERNGGDTERSSAAQVFTAGTPYRVRVVMDGTSYVTWVDTTMKNTYTDAGSFNTTATGVKASGFTTGADLVAYPRDVSSLLPSL